MSVLQLKTCALCKKSLTNKLQRVLNADANVTSDTGKYDRELSQLLHEKLHRLDVRDWVMFKLVVVVHPRLNSRAPQYIAVHCVPLSNQRHFRSAERNLLHVPCHRLNTYGRLAFAIAAPSARNSLSDLYPQSELHRSSFQAPAYDIFVRTVLATFRRWCAVQILLKLTHWQCST